MIAALALAALVAAAQAGGLALGHGYAAPSYGHGYAAAPAYGYAASYGHGYAAAPILGHGYGHGYAAAPILGHGYGHGYAAPVLAKAHAPIVSSYSTVTKHVAPVAVAKVAAPIAYGHGLAYGHGAYGHY